MQSTEQLVPSDNQPSWQEEEVHLSDYLSILRRQKTAFFAVFFVIFALVALYTFLTTPLYQASSSLHIRDEKGKVDLLGELGLAQSSPIEAEIQILKSRTNAEEVVRRLNLNWKVEEKSPGLSGRVLDFSSSAEEPVYKIELTGEGRYDVKDSNDKLVGKGRSGELLRGDGFDLLLTDLPAKKGPSFRLSLHPFNSTVRGLREQLQAIELGKKTNILKLTYTSDDPVEARDVVNTLVQVFQERSVNLKTQEARKSLEFIADQLKNVRVELDIAEKKLESFKSTSGLVKLDTEAESFIERLAGTEKQLAALNVRKKQLDFAVEVLTEAMMQGENYSPSLMANDPVVAGLAQQLVEYDVQKKVLLGEYTLEHPTLLSLSRQVVEVQSKILATYQSNLQDIIQQQAGLREELGGYEQQLKQMPEAERQLAQLARQSQVNADIYTFLLQKHEEARILRASTMGNIDIIDPAIAPDRPIKPNKKKNLLLGLILGLMAGVGFAFFLEYMDGTIKDPDQAKRLFGIPALAIIPFLGSSDRSKGGRGHTLVSQLDLKSPAAEAFRALRTSIHYSAINKEKRVLMVTSMFPGEGKTTIAANLAVTIAQTGERVLIIGCDLRKPTLHEFFKGENRTGLTEILIGDQSFSTTVNLDGAPGVDFLSAGKTPPNPAELLGSKTMAQLVSILRESYDHIILDAPPFLVVTDAVVLSELADLVLIGFELGRTTTKITQPVRDQLANFQAPIAGLVCNDKLSRGSSYYGDYYGSYYGNEDP